MATKQVCLARTSRPCTWLKDPATASPTGGPVGCRMASHLKNVVQGWGQHVHLSRSTGQIVPCSHVQGLHVGCRNVGSAASAGGDDPFRSRAGAAPTHHVVSCKHAHHLQTICHALACLQARITSVVGAWGWCTMRSTAGRLAVALSLGCSRKAPLLLLWQAVEQSCASVESSSVKAVSRCKVPGCRLTSHHQVQGVQC